MQKVVLTTFWRFFAESLKKFLLKIRKKNSEKKNQKTVSSANFTLDTYTETWEPFQRFLQKIQNDLKLLKYILSHSCSSGRVEGSFDKFLTFFGQKSEKIFAQNPEKFRKEEWKKNFFFRKFYSAHVYRNLRTIPKVSAENPKRFKIFKKIFQATNCSSGHAEGSFDNFLKIFRRKSEKIFAQNPKKTLKRKIRKLFHPQILLWTRI